MGDTVMSSENTAQETATSQETTQAAPQESAASSSAQSSTSNAQAASAVETAAQVAQATQAPLYTPNYKFKAYDKEYEVDELFRPLFKDKDTEEKIRSLHSKAYAMEVMREKQESSKKEFDSFRSEADPKLKAFDAFQKIVGKKDWDTFFNKLGVPDEEIFEYVQRKLNLMQAPADQRAEYERNLALRQQAYMQEEQLRQYESAYQEQAVQARTMQLESLMARPDVQKYASAWDEKMGNVGAFRQLVIDEATNTYIASQGRIDMSAEQAVNHVIQKFGKVVAAQTMAQPQMPGAQPQAAQTPPIIPHVAGRGTSPVKKVPKSLDDLRKLGDEMSR